MQRLFFTALSLATSSLATFAFAEDTFCGKVTSVRGWDGVSSVSLYNPSATDNAATVHHDAYVALRDLRAIRALESLSGLDLSEYLLERRIFNEFPEISTEKLFVCVDGFTLDTQLHYGTHYAYLKDVGGLRVWQRGQSLGTWSRDEN